MRDKNGFTHLLHLLHLGLFKARIYVTLQVRCGKKNRRKQERKGQNAAHLKKPAAYLLSIKLHLTETEIDEIKDGAKGPNFVTLQRRGCICTYSHGLCILSTPRLSRRTPPVRVGSGPVLQNFEFAQSFCPPLRLNY